MSGRRAPHLGAPRNISGLLGESLSIYKQEFLTFFVIAAAITIPAQVIVSGIGLEQITSDFKDDPSTAEALVPTIVSYLIVAPLIMATTVHALRALAADERPRPLAAIQAALDVFTPLFAAVLLTAAGIMLGLAALILPGVYLLVLWFFVPQAVVVEGRRGTRALAASAILVRGNWWRCFGIVLLTNLAAALPGILILTPIEAAARSADTEAIAFAGRTIVECLTAPFVAIVATLLYYDLRARAQSEPSRID